MIYKDLPTIPVQPLLHKDGPMPPMPSAFSWLAPSLPVCRYSHKTRLREDLASSAIGPVETHAGG